MEVIVAMVFLLKVLKTLRTLHPIKMILTRRLLKINLRNPRYLLRIVIHLRKFLFKNQPLLIQTFSLNNFKGIFNTSITNEEHSTFTHTRTIGR